MTREAKYLEAIYQAIEKHARKCGNPPTQIRMNPLEVERLGWDEIRGLPIVGDPGLGTGVVHIDCDGFPLVPAREYEQVAA